jgi:hypothetical protein
VRRAIDRGAAVAAMGALPRSNAALPNDAAAVPRTIDARANAVCFALSAQAPPRASVEHVVDPVPASTIVENPGQESGATNEQRSVVESR